MVAFRSWHDLQQITWVVSPEQRALTLLLNATRNFHDGSISFGGSWPADLLSQGAT